MSETQYGTRSERVENVRTDTETEPIAEAEAEKNLTSSRSDAQRGRREIEETHQARLAAITESDVLAWIALRKRSGWTATDCVTWARSDDRSFDEKLTAASNAHDVETRHPNGLRYVGAQGQLTPTPMRIDDWRGAERCPNGAIHDPHPCALCRAGVGA